MPGLFGLRDGRILAHQHHALAIIVPTNKPRLRYVLNFVTQQSLAGLLCTLSARNDFCEVAGPISEVKHMLANVVLNGAPTTMRKPMA
ncbi:MAG TPA: hypothetical protein VK572_10525 [Burkholderiales bacterium]|nr:hypothetical protein [Burkholderiales bacterium]